MNRKRVIAPENGDELAATVADFDEDGAFTREFLLRRDFCCENGCRNCPYGFISPDDREKQDFSTT